MSSSRVRVNLLALFITAAACLTAPSLAHAQKTEAFSGNRWYGECNSKAGTGDETRCIGYVIGLDQGLNMQALLTDSKKLFCTPQEVTYGQKIDVFVKYMADHPEQRHEDAAALYVVAMGTAFPCKEGSAFKSRR
jgi:hypothetical protein